jgi:hypothetical protein
MILNDPVLFSSEEYAMLGNVTCNPVSVMTFVCSTASQWCGRHSRAIFVRISLLVMYAWVFMSPSVMASQLGLDEMINLSTHDETYHITALWGSGGSDIFAVGYAGAIFHYDGVAWTRVANSGTQDLYGVWGSAANDVYVVGDSGTILHYDGTSWSTITSGTDEQLTAIWGTGSSDVFVLGYNGTVLHFDGETWSSTDLGVSTWVAAIWGSGPNDVFVVGGIGTILHYNGTEWSAMNSGVTNALWSISGTGPDDVYVGGSQFATGSLLHYDGVSWSVVSIENAPSLAGVWCSDEGEVFAVNGYLWKCDDAVWAKVPADTSKLTYGSNVWGSSSTGVYTWGYLGFIAHYASVGTLSIGTTPVSGEVFVDGESWGVVPVSKEIAFGQHTVSFGSKDGYATPADQTASVAAGQTTTITGTYVAVDDNGGGDDDGGSGGMCGAAGVMAIIATMLAGLCLGYTGTKE